MTLVALTLKLGLPVALLTWYLFSRLYDRGDLDQQDEPGAAFKALKQRSKAEKLTDDNLVQQRWMTFGGGYYGLTALWTFVVIELVDFFQLVTDFPGLSALFADGIIAFVIGFMINQLTNLIAAFLWFTYWDGIIVVLIVSYAGYLIGMDVARRGFRFDRHGWRIKRPAVRASDTTED